MAEQDKAELIARIDIARGEIARSLDGLRHDADLGSRFKSSFSENKTVWLGSAGIAGWLLSRLPARKKKVIVHTGGSNGGGNEIKRTAETGLVLALLKMLFPVVRPFIISFATRLVSDFAAKRERYGK